MSESENNCALEVVGLNLIYNLILESNGEDVIFIAICLYD